MDGAEASSEPARIRREPPQYREVEVRGVEPVGPHLTRVTFAGPNLEAMAQADPAASVRVLLPAPGTSELVMPTWNGNEFLLADGSRPTLRTFTPLRAGPGELAIEVVAHDGGIASGWAATAVVGGRVAISGPGRGYIPNQDAPAFLIGGDETAIPAIGQLLGAISTDALVRVCIEVAQPDGRIPLLEHPGATIEWVDLPTDAPPGDALVASIRAADLVPGVRIWAAGEAAAVQRIRRYLFEEREIPRAQTSVRGYWKHGRAGNADDS